MKVDKVLFFGLWDVKRNYRESMGVSTSSRSIESFFFSLYVKVFAFSLRERDVKCSWQMKNP